METQIEPPRDSTASKWLKREMLANTPCRGRLCLDHMSLVGLQGDPTLNTCGGFLGLTWPFHSIYSWEMKTYALPSNLQEHLQSCIHH